MDTRKKWIDQARGLSIFLVVYGHNFPINEPYIYSFHVPLFFFIAGMFHPKNVTFSVVKRRAIMILVPYFIWATLLFLFWAFVGRKFGDSSEAGLSVLDNFLGIFYAQGGQTYMDWGIPMWFLPCIFLVFVSYAAIQKIKNRLVSQILLLVVVLAGFIIPKTLEIHLPWSLDVAWVAMGFYAFGNVLKETLFKLTKLQALVTLVILGIIHVVTFYYNPSKVDMYRSLYGDEVFFFVSGLTGSVAYLLFFKLVPVFNFLSYLGKHTIVILATHLRALTVIKLVLMLVVGMTVFEFTEWQKFVVAIVQVLLVIPVIWLVNKYAPLLDGKVTKS